MSGWWLVLSHIFCFAIGGFVALHPDTIKAWAGSALDRVKSLKK